MAKIFNRVLFIFIFVIFYIVCSSPHLYSQDYFPLREGLILKYSSRLWITNYPQKPFNKIFTMEITQKSKNVDTVIFDGIFVEEDYSDTSAISIDTTQIKIYELGNLILIPKIFKNIIPSTIAISSDTSYFTHYQHNPDSTYIAGMNSGKRTLFLVSQNEEIPWMIGGSQHQYYAFKENLGFVKYHSSFTNNVQPGSYKWYMHEINLISPTSLKKNEHQKIKLTNVIIRPNPFSNTTTISFASLDPLGYEVYNSRGELIVYKQNLLQTSYFLNGVDLANGVYIIKIRFSDKVIARKFSVKK